MIRPARRTYRREIDGLRALAVLPVILFHAGLPAFAGGYLGVDIFFVISGYLITGILLRDLAAGEFSIARFYERRARRILPALTVVLLACVPFGLTWMSPIELRELAEGVVAVALSASNVLYWLRLDYFGPDAETLPLLHTWSLGIEEQFYLIFPLALAALWRWRSGATLAVIAAGLAASLGLAVWAAGDAPSAGFFLLPFRAWELLLGSAVAVWMARPDGDVSSPAAGGLGGAGLAAILLAMALVPLERLPGLAPVVLACFGAALVIRYTRPGGLVYRLLAHPAPVGIGLISYSAYLWHQPLLAFARLRIGPLDAPVAIGLGIAALALAWPTWAYVERPFRRPGAGSPLRPLLAGGAALGVLVAVGAVGLVSNGLDARKSPAARAILASVTDVNPHRGACKTDFDGENPAHPVAACLVDGTLPAVAFYGDSHADALQGGFWPAAEAAGFRFYSVTRSACPPIPGLTLTGAAASPDCDAFVRGVEAFAREGGFDVVVLAARWTAGAAPTAFDNGEGGVEGKPGDFRTPIGAEPRTHAEREAGVIAQYVAGVEGLLRAGFRVVLVDPIPEAGWNVPEELARRRERSVTPVMLSTAREVYERRHAAVLAAFDGINDANLFRVRTQDLLCDGFVPGRCVNNIGDRPLYFDNNHLNTFGAGLVAPLIIEAVEAARRSLHTRQAGRHPAATPTFD